MSSLCYYCLFAKSSCSPIPHIALSQRYLLHKCAVQASQHPFHELSLKHGKVCCLPTSLKTGLVYTEQLIWVAAESAVQVRYYFWLAPCILSNITDILTVE